MEQTSCHTTRAYTPSHIPESDNITSLESYVRLLLWRREFRVAVVLTPLLATSYQLLYSTSTSTSNMIVHSPTSLVVQDHIASRVASIIIIQLLVGKYYITPLALRLLLVLLVLLLLLLYTYVVLLLLLLLLSQYYHSNY